MVTLESGLLKKTTFERTQKSLFESQQDSKTFARMLFLSEMIIFCVIPSFWQLRTENRQKNKNLASWNIEYASEWLRSATRGYENWKARKADRSSTNSDRKVSETIPNERILHFSTFRSRVNEKTADFWKRPFSRISTFSARFLLFQKSSPATWLLGWSNFS